MMYSLAIGFGKIIRKVFVKSFLLLGFLYLMLVSFAPEAKADEDTSSFLGTMFSDAKDETKQQLSNYVSNTKFFDAPLVALELVNMRKEKESDYLKREYEAAVSFFFETSDKLELSIGIDGLDASRLVFGGYYQVYALNENNRIHVGVQIAELGDDHSSYNGWHSRLTVSGTSSVTTNFGVIYGVTEGFYYNELYTVKLGVLYKLK